MREPLLHPRTAASISLYINRPPHGLLLVGSEGSGKIHLAKWLASELHAPLLTIAPEENKQAISIDQIRSLYSQTKTGTLLCVVIEDAHRLGKDAQNAFLKLLEEPPPNTYFILTTSKESLLLPTIRSRCQVIQVLPPSSRAIKAMLPQENSELDRLLHSNKDSIGTLYKLLEDEDTRQQHQTMLEQAKQFYSAAPYQRHIMLIEQQFDQAWASNLLDILALVLQTLLGTKAEDEKVLSRLIRQAELVQVTARNLRHIAGNPKIHLTKLAETL